MTVSVRAPLLLSLLLAFGCNQIKALVGGNAKQQAAKPTAVAPADRAAAEHGDARAAADDKADEHGAEKAGHGKERFGLPFAYETSPTEPLARARGFLAEMLGANLTQVAKGRGHFTPFIDRQTPRATVVACADSRVQASAWDQTPENDNFTIRNIGNQVNNALGSIEYGVEHLHTPLLLIVGHSGCGAVKAALSKPAGLSEPILAELAHLELPPARKGASAQAALTDAVIANVNAQVATATRHFSNLVHSGELTVVGAVYDFRNELGKGHGKLQIVNVNTNHDPARVEAFLQAVQASPGIAAGGEAEETVQDRVKKLLDRAQRTLPPRRRPDVTVSSVELNPTDHGGGRYGR